MDHRRPPATLALFAVVVVCLSASAAIATAATPTKSLPGFHSPGANIECFYVPASRDDSGHVLPSQLLCSIHAAVYAKKLQSTCLNPPGAPGTGVDWHGWRLGASGKGAINCSGGILYDPSLGRPSYTPLPYGKTWRHGVFSCSSKATGVTCTNGSKHGLFISRTSWRAW